MPISRVYSQSQVSTFLNFRRCHMTRAEMPGMKKEDIEVTVTDRTMRISGEKKREEKIEKKI
jgi:hypothetical protein